MATTYQKTKDLKDSGIEWIGSVPKDWDIYPGLKFFVISKDKVKEGELEPLSAGYMGVVPQLENAAQNVSEGDRKHVLQGDIILNSRSDRMGAVGLSNYEGGVSLIYHVWRPKSSEIEPRYYHHLYRNTMFSQEYYRYGNGIVDDLWSTKDYALKRIVITKPPLETQKRIADFLDEKTATIDAVIEKKQKLIELLKEQRTAIITKAVTKGLDPKVKMKDSGVEWIGEIPEGWIVSSPNGVFKVIRGNCCFNKGDLKDEGDFVALQYGKTYKVDEVNEDFQFYVDESFYKDDQVVKIEDTILISTSETIEDLGHSCYYNRKDLGLLGGEQMCLKPKESIIGKFLHYATHHFKIELNQYATGIKVYRFRVDDLKKINIVVPPVNEQKRIVNFLDEKTSKIDKTIEVTIQQIKKLKEYRASLIYNAVTGKTTI